jgi:holo-[acyl-carrier protein] synthase
MVIGIGVDIVDIARARHMLHAYGDRILARVCTPAESEYVRSHFDGAQYLAVRLAAKEATYKALAGSVEARSIGWREIEVIAADGGPPGLALHGRARERMNVLHATHALLSLSHSDTSAVAVVLIQGTAGAG